jgi:hypothetical protein
VDTKQRMVVGECYLCGHSHGEAILGLLPPNVKPIWTPVNSRSYAEVLEDGVTGVNARGP